jgi:phenylalanyl-tRNA synthetase alpha chain
LEIKDLIKKLHPLEQKVLAVLSNHMAFDDIVNASKLQEIEVMRALQWLQNKKIINLKETVKEVVELDTNGLKYVEDGLPEKRLLKVLGDGFKDADAVFEDAGISSDEKNICIGSLKRKAAILISKEGAKLLLNITPQGKKLLEKPSLEEEFLKKDFPIEIKSLSPEENFAFTELKRRKSMIKTNVIKLREAELTNIGKEILKEGVSSEDFIDRLTPEIINKGSWKNKQIRSYDVSINVPNISGGRRHFVNQAIEYVKRIWLDMGFIEMGGNIVQTSFWDLDSLFVPQDHPAREMQDTFYVKDPSKGKLPALSKKIKEVHENGADTGSLGWQCKWDIEKAKENLIRTHTTVLSAQTISRLKKEDLPLKFFSVGKVFRNEALDWKHLFEFYQVEGIVVDPNANIKNLKGYLREFFGKMGYPDVRMRPAHFPYTEPSMEVDVFHPVKKEWVELGGSGIFRPEVTKPLIGEEVPVLAWGLGMPRTISSYYGITDIRDLYKNDLKQMREMKYWLK